MSNVIDPFEMVSEVSISTDDASLREGKSAKMHGCVAVQAPRAPVSGINQGGAPRLKATAAARRVTVATALPGSEAHHSYSRREALITGVSGAALLAAPQCRHISSSELLDWGTFKICGVSL